MNNQLKKALLIIFCMISITNLYADNFEAKVIPSIMDSDMDCWYKVPLNSGPNIHLTSSIYKNQTFNLLIFYRGYAVDKNNNINVSYDVQIFDPQGNPTGDEGFGLVAYKGVNPNGLLLNNNYLRIVFTDRYIFGNYLIKVKSYDNVSKKVIETESKIELIPYSPLIEFTNMEDVAEWMMNYYNELTPIKSVNAIQVIVKPDEEWIVENENILAFFRRLYRDNPFLFKIIEDNFHSFSLEDQKKFLLISAITGDKSLFENTGSNKDKDLKEYFQKINKIEISAIDIKVISSNQLDILWSEYFASGRYEPILRIVKSLELVKYRGTIDKYKSGEINMTEETEKEMYLDATYQAALWSLISNCRQSPLVYKYCNYIYKNEKLEENVQIQLGTILKLLKEEFDNTNNNTKKKK